MQCKATNRKGAQCRNDAIVGGAVCRMHGGAAPQVREAARQRMLELIIGPGMARAAKILRSAKSKDSDAVAILNSFLDRNGFKPKEKHEVVVKSPKDMTADELREWASELGQDGAATDPGEDPAGD